MKRPHRLEAILDTIASDGQVMVGEAAERFGVSDMTVRRDLEELERQGLCRRVHGGAVSAVSRSYEPAFAVRSEQSNDAKNRIGQDVADQLVQGETVFLDIGTSTLVVAEALRGRQSLTIITPSLRIASLLADEANLRVILTGGVVRPGERSLVGSMAETFLQQFFVDVAVLGVGGIDADAGLTEFNLDDAAIKRAAIGRARRIIVAADASKIGEVAFAGIAPASAVDVLVTDATLTHPSIAPLMDAGIDVHSV